MVQIFKQGAAWSTVRGTLTSLTTEVERMIRDCPGPNSHGDWAFHDTVYSGTQPTTVEIREGATVRDNGKVVARWVGGKRVSL